MGLTDKYTSANEVTRAMTDSDVVGLCGFGLETCYDLVLLNKQRQGSDHAQLFRELKRGEPDYNEALAKFSKEMNAVFREKAADLLTKFVRDNATAKGEVHLAAIGSPKGLHLAFATRLPAEEMLKRGANLAKAKLQQFYEQLVEPPATGTTKSKAKTQ